MLLDGAQLVLYKLINIIFRRGNFVYCHWELQQFLVFCLTELVTKSLCKSSTISNYFPLWWFRESWWRKMSYCIENKQFTQTSIFWKRAKLNLKLNGMNWIKLVVYKIKMFGPIVFKGIFLYYSRFKKIISKPTITRPIFWEKLFI